LKSKYSSVYDQLQEANARGGKMSGYTQNLETQLSLLQGQITSLSDVKTHAAYQELLQKGGALQNELTAANVKLVSQGSTIGELERRYAEADRRATQMEQGGTMVINNLRGQLKLSQSREGMGYINQGSNKRFAPEQGRSALDQGDSMIGNPYQQDFASNSNHNQSSTSQLQVEYNDAERRDQAQALATNIQDTQGVLSSFGFSLSRQPLNLGGLDVGRASAALSAAFENSLESDDPTKVMDIFGKQYQNAIRVGLSDRDIKNAINTVLAHKFGGASGGGAAPLLQVSSVSPRGITFKKGKTTTTLNYL